MIQQFLWVSVSNRIEFATSGKIFVYDNEIFDTEHTEFFTSTKGAINDKRTKYEICPFLDMTYTTMKYCIFEGWYDAGEMPNLFSNFPK